MATIERAPATQIDYSHSEQLYDSISNFTIDPIKNIFYYALPWLSTWGSGQIALRETDAAQQEIMDPESKKIILQEIRSLAQAGGLNREVTVYTALNHRFASYGGSHSCSNPVIFIPYQHLFRPELSSFGQERAGELLENETWRFSDNETRFLIARELSQIKNNDSILKTAIKVLFVAAMICVYASPFGWGSSALLFLASGVLYMITERCAQKKMDLDAVNMLAARIGDANKAKEAAISALEKMRQQNLIRREQSCLCKLYITSSGNNVLDLAHPFITNRIDYLQRS